MKTFLIIPIMLCSINLAIGQVDKIKVRVSAQYVKIMGQESFLSFSAKYKRESGFEPASGLEFHIYQKISEDSLYQIGTITTSHNGTAKFILNKNHKSISANANDFEFVIKIENDPTYADAETELRVSDATLAARLETIDSVHQITATLTDASGQPLKGLPLKVQLQRMYAPLTIGEESYETDENGSVLVPVKEPMPGIDGKLTFEVVLDESDLYGTVKAIVSAPIGIPIVEKSTFDQRTMWSPPSKTPVYLLIFPNLIILGVWVPILMLLFSLYKISKSKTNSL